MAARVKPETSATSIAGKATTTDGLKAGWDAVMHECTIHIEITDDDIVIDAGLLAPLLKVATEEVPDLMRRQAITSVCERGVGEPA